MEVPIVETLVGAGRLRRSGRGARRQRMLRRWWAAWMAETDEASAQPPPLQQRLTDEPEKDVDLAAAIEASLEDQERVLRAARRGRRVRRNRSRTSVW